VLARNRGVRAFSLHPGGIHTPLQRHLPREELVQLGVLNEDGTPVGGGRLKTPEQGAATQVWAATSPQLADHGGVYLEDCDVAGIRTGTDITAKGVFPYAVDPDEAARLWALSAELTGVNAFARAEADRTGLGRMGGSQGSHPSRLLPVGVVVVQRRDHLVVVAACLAVAEELHALHLNLLGVR
jgi:NAD(P)-dependent dehydrogenase (short-subunit alcohol dehydrogenase family)